MISGCQETLQVYLFMRNKAFMTHLFNESHIIGILKLPLAILNRISLNSTMLTRRK